MMYFCGQLSPSIRVSAAAEAVPALVSAYFDALMHAVGDADTISDVALAVLQRYFQLYLITSFRRDVRKVLRNKLHALFSLSPSFVFRYKVRRFGCWCVVLTSAENCVWNHCGLHGKQR